MAAILTRGDVGLVTMPGTGAIGAIWTGRRWAVKARDSVIVAGFAEIAAWNLPPTRSGDGDLARFLARAAAAPFRFGECDCALTVANWVLTATGRDPAAALRGRYRTRIGWLRIVGKAGGMEALFDGLARAADLKRVR